jgi:hypothetical protein
MTFKEFNQRIQQQFSAMQKFKLFRLNISGQQIWEAYLSGFLPENNPIFRDPESSTHNCNNDKNFIRRYGNIVAIDNNFNIVSMFDIDVEGSPYHEPVNAIKQLISTGEVSDVFFETFMDLNVLPYERADRNLVAFQLGLQKTLKKYNQEEADKFGVVNTSDVYEFHHFYVHLNREFVSFTNNSVESIMGNYRDAKNVFKRAMDEIPLDTLLLVKDLIVQGSLLNGTAHLDKLNTFIPFKEEYDKLSAEKKDNWCWVKSYNLPIAKFRNELIGTLCVELSQGEELNNACKTWNMRIDPANYMKAKAPITQRQIAEAQKFVIDNGYEESFNRRFATLSDIDVSEIRHMNVDGKAKPVGLFAGVQPSVSTRHKRSQFDGVEEVTIDKFMSDILPTCTSVEAFVENRFDGNMVSLITSAENSKPLFKWNNPFSWTYNGNLAGKSQIKENVKAVGGKVTGILRCSLQWNDEDTKGIVDYDLHCKTPFHNIYYADQKCTRSGGWLDIDMIRPSKIGIENITWQNQMPDGKYVFRVHTFCSGNNTGFKVEIEMNGDVFNYHYGRSTAYKSYTDVATVTVKNGVMSIEHHLRETTSSRTIWGVETGQFHKVNLVCLSPNYWGTKNVGNKHYFFMLDGCAADVPLRSFHNEYLNGDLLNHRKVTEVLADTTKLEPTANQLAGLGFNATVKDELIVKLTGTHKRTIKIKI